MSETIVIFIETILYSVLVSFFTVGLSASSKPGALLYPFRLFLESREANVALTEKRLKYKQYKEYRLRKHYSLGLYVDKLLDKKLIHIDIQLLWVNRYTKPLLLCVYCMPSLWGTVLYWSCPMELSLWTWLIGIPIASTLNYYVKNEKYGL